MSGKPLLVTKRTIGLAFAVAILLTLFLVRGSFSASPSTVAKGGFKAASPYNNNNNSNSNNNSSSSSISPELGDENLKDTPAPATGTKLGFDHVYVINLERRRDRRQIMGKLMSYLNIQYELFRATNETEVDNTNKTGPVDIKYHIRPAERACMRSHMNVLKDIVIHGYQHALILEDDVDFEADIKSRMGDLLPHVPAAWDILYLGHCSRERFKQTEFHKDLFVARRPSCTHAYAVSFEGAKTALGLLEEGWPNPDKPYDLTLIGILNKLDAFSVEPPYIVQVRDEVPPGDVAPDTRIAKQWLERSALFEIGMRPHVYELD
ncbi:hypothetical protein GGI12_002796 [Dipsacomyces acuminosporus]|nr:hypothetical protein GGI12_002796 [Dipsacomyces acuminosporus]